MNPSDLTKDELLSRFLQLQQRVEKLNQETNRKDERIELLERTRQDEFDALAQATAATAVQSIDDLSGSDIGTAGSVERRAVGRTHLLIVTDLPKDSPVSLLLRGGTKHVAEETNRIIECCIAAVRSVLEQGYVLPGGGAVETALAMDLSSTAVRIDGREQLAVKAFASALEGIPRTLITNMGHDPTELLPKLRNRHEECSTVGISSSSGKLADMREIGVLEPMSVKQRSLVTAVETTAMILRIDDILQHPAQNTDGDDAVDANQASRTHLERDIGGYPWAIGH